MKFKFEKAKLANKSGVFADMFEVGESGEGVDEVPMTETSEVLEALLSSCDGKNQVGLTRNGDLPWPVFKAFDKYDVSCPARSRSAGSY